MNSEQVTFADEYIGPIATGQKDTTVRYGGYYDVSVGEILEVVNQDGQKECAIVVEKHCVCPVSDAIAVIDALGGKHGCDSLGGLLESLNRHYNQTVLSQTPVSIIVFEVLPE